MSRINQLRPQFVDLIPDCLDQGVLYVSQRYSTAAHLCCCGCGREVITPFNPAKWNLTVGNGFVSLTPSVGNWSFPCKSHYWIDSNRVRWAPAMSPEWIVSVQERDRRDADFLVPEQIDRLARVRKFLREAWATAWRGLTHMLRR